jgi:thiol:disulfide interchange protein
MRLQGSLPSSVVAVAILAAALMATVCPSSAQVRPVYAAPAESRHEVADGLQRAAATHRRVILDFGGNWCTDCLVLDHYFHDDANRPILDANFVLVHVNVGRMNENLDIAAKYGIPLNKGVPALAVLDVDGRLLFSQRSGEFEAMRGMQSAAVTKFLQQWAVPRG